MQTINLSELVSYLDEQLKPHKINDYCPNGLQLEGSAKVGKIVTGVTASQALIDRAIELKADALLVHHGYFWKGEAAAIRGIKKNRIKALLQHDISLIAYHLPLDVHLEFGNNVQLAKVLGWQVDEVARNYPLPLVRTATLQEECSGDAMRQHIHQSLSREPLHIAADRPIRRVGWCTGAAQSYFEEAIAMGVDAFVSGEISEQTVHLARENQVHYFAAGHHATERYGVCALGERIRDKFSIAVEFVDCDNPV